MKEIFKVKWLYKITDNIFLLYTWGAVGFTMGLFALLEGWLFPLLGIADDLTTIDNIVTSIVVVCVGVGLLIFSLYKIYKGRIKVE